jgi:hypothetical protein
VRLIIIWLWFVAQLTPMHCLTQPTLIELPELPGHILGQYQPSTSTVFVDRDAPRMVAVHEFAHHLWHVCHVADRPIGRRFLRAVGAEGWGTLQKEQFAATLTWMLTGAGGYPTVRSAGWVFGRITP